MEYNNDFLKKAFFSETGIKRFRNTVVEFEKNLFEKSVNFGKTNQEKDMPLEITSENVRDAVIKIQNTQNKQKTHPLLIISNILEYIFTITATIGVSNLDKEYGIILFIVFSGITVLLITIRLIYRR